ncbi:YdbL family protein [Rubellicoccus peritrichatus]|uniref:YdbL family protein n=1 Tax=Rubellicoccus peritrichatus TaxID=3080537 RepID=A0AAQ3LBJ9_9BACT|nr:YdbL family protein [Puniceicoccus sp. CR14]WOO42830.1 YdbL family protein [Puniceicoccus sp. CR14]
MKNIQLFIFFILGLGLASSVSAQNLSAIKSNMQKRLPQIEQLWKQGLVGENNEGYLSSRGSLNDAQKKLMNAENSDRKQVYTSIAKNADTTPAKVGKQRAAQIANRAAKGLWLQKPDGKWYKK